MTEKAPNTERRKPRVSRNLFLWFKMIEEQQEAVENRHATTEGLARVVDLSADGVGFVSTHALPLGQLIFLEITSPRGNLSALGRLRNCTDVGNQYRIGVLFEVIPPNDRAVLSAMLT